MALLEANLDRPKRLSGEWLHPPAVRMLRQLGIELNTPRDATIGKGFVVFPEDRSEPIQLPYPNGSHGWTCEHALLVSRLRETVRNEPGVDLMLNTRVRAVEDDRVTYNRNGENRFVLASRIVGSDGRASIVRRSLGISARPLSYTGMIGITLRGVNLPFEGYGHLVSGGPSPMLFYRVGEQSIRVIVDIPRGHSNRDLFKLLHGSYANLLPEMLRPAFIKALHEGHFQAANSALMPRFTHGNARRVLIGDAVGYYHPMTAVGMTLGFGDALELAEDREFHDFAANRLRATRAPEFAAMGLYEVFCDHRPEGVAVRKAMYQRWRSTTLVRHKSMDMLACEDNSMVSLGLALAATISRAIADEAPRTLDRAAWRRAGAIVRSLIVGLCWQLRSAEVLREARRTGGGNIERIWRTLPRAYLVSMRSKANDHSLPEDTSPDPDPALGTSGTRLLGRQRQDGS